MNLLANIFSKQSKTYLVTKDIKTEVTLDGKEFHVDYLNMSSDKSMKAAAELEKMVRTQQFCRELWVAEKHV
ncbi:hypothetical protein DPMN_170513 [Dreissena polymorpha]|uniref:Uncharacterized protein n=1 Tax=Dreissena polymorpha TaxID=45954 RepID=A0A9D4IEN3_DREPO|nr:hypothetical protein DPMN_170513 [Dreissena polymorpha]